MFFKDMGVDTVLDSIPKTVFCGLTVEVPGTRFQEGGSQGGKPMVGKQGVKFPNLLLGVTPPIRVGALPA